MKHAWHRRSNHHPLCPDRLAGKVDHRPAQKVEDNDGTAGVDRVTVLDFSIGVQQRLLELRDQLLEKRGILCVASTTERIVTDNPDGSKISCSDSSGSVPTSLQQQSTIRNQKSEIRNQRSAIYNPQSNMNTPINYSPLHPLRFAKFSLLLEATEELHLPEYKGSTLRGGFGNAFKKAVCMTKTFDCPPCLLQKACPYFSIFESNVERGIADLLRIGRDAPHPFVLEPPLTEQREFKKGEQLTANLVLIGKAIDMLPYFIYAFTVLGERVGLGKAKGKFAVRHVSDAEGKKVYDGQTQTLSEGLLAEKDSYRIFTFAEFADGAGSTSGNPSLRERITLNFITPTRIMTSYGSGSRHLIRLREAEDFWTLIETLYHRVFALTNLYCAAEVLDYTTHKMTLNLSTASLTNADIRWQDWERYSNRQQTRMKLGGFLGRATFEGKLGKYLPLLRIGEHLHVGKSTSCGLGKYELL